MTEGHDSVSKVLHARQTEDKVTNQERVIDSLNRQNRDIQQELDELKEILEVRDNKLNPQGSRQQLKVIIAKIKAQNDTFAEENRQMTKVISDLKSGKYNESAGARIISEQIQA